MIEQGLEPSLPQTCALYHNSILLHYAIKSKNYTFYMIVFKFYNNKKRYTLINFKNRT